MNRPVLLLTLGADPLPATTPVIPVPATWVPAIYVPPPVPTPTGLLASAIADAVLLTWSAVDALAPEYEIERASDVAGVPGTWARISTTMDLRYIAAAPDGLAYWFRLRTESLGRLSDYTAPVVGVPIASNPVVVPLAIVAGVVTINCAYQQFKLVLNANVTSVVFVNVPPATTILIEIEQMGAFTIAWPSSVTPISGVPYVVSATAGAVDMVGLTTNNTGVTWRLTAQKPVADSGTGTSFVVTLAPSPANASVVTDGTTATAPSVQVTASTAGGTAPIAHAWTRADAAGGTNFSIDNPAIAAPTFSIPAGVTAYNAMQQWRDTVTDAATLSTQALVEITLARVLAQLSDSFNGAIASAYGFGTTGPTGGVAEISFKRDGTWQTWAATTSDGITAPGSVIASGTWHSGATATIGDDYEVIFTPTGGGGTLFNGAAAYAALSATRTIQLDYHRSTSGSLTVSRSVAVAVRKITDPGINTSGTMSLEVTGDNS